MSGAPLEQSRVTRAHNARAKARASSSGCGAKLIKDYWKSETCESPPSRYEEGGARGGLGNMLLLDKMLPTDRML